VGNLLSTAKIHGIGITVEPDEVGWPVGYDPIHPRYEQ
jgi:hypothetical protein